MCVQQNEPINIKTDTWDGETGTRMGLTRQPALSDQQQEIQYSAFLSLETDYQLMVVSNGTESHFLHHFSCCPHEFNIPPLLFFSLDVLYTLFSPFLHSSPVLFLPGLPGNCFTALLGTTGRFTQV